MDWLAAIGDSFLTTLPWFVGFALGYAVLTRLCPCNSGMFWGQDRAGIVTDVLYWFAMPVIARVLKTWVLAVGLSISFAGGEPGFTAIRSSSLWMQCAAILVLQDVMLYWIHRAFHTRAGWSFHAVHHSPRLLDWAAAARTHIVNYLFSFILVDIIVLLLGFRVEALIALTPLNLLYASMVHANLNWTFGPLRYVFASPVFHRWHHVSEGEGIDKNFASTFPVLDLIFGTFYMPPGIVPEHFGNGDLEYPEDFWGQTMAPFVRREKASEIPDTSAREAA
jgi:sterol desaturase/sphingolipid hydroxylase (fatty acid hydroxylase superfamily)